MITRFGATAVHPGLSFASVLIASAVVPGTPALAQEAPPKEFTVSGSAAIVSDYRFRGVSQSDKQIAVQAGATVTHESGVYAGLWGSNLAGWGTFGGANLELDLIGGYKFPVSSGVSLDVGLTWYMYPGGASNTDFAEPYVKLSGTLGPVSVLGGVAYAPKQEALGNFSNTPQSRGQSQDNLYVWTDLSSGIPKTPITLKGHLGYSHGNPGLGPNGTSVAPTGEYLDWSLGADYVLAPVTLSIAYIDTDIGRRESAYLLPNFSSTKNGSSIAGATVVVSAAVSF